MVAILKTIENGESELRLNQHEINCSISLNDSNNIDFSESEKKKKVFCRKKYPKSPNMFFNVAAILYTVI